MSSDIGALFKPRQPRLSSSAASGPSLLVSEPRHRNSLQKDAFSSKIGESAAQELTKNNHYCVSRLPATPTVLNGQERAQYLNGYADHSSNYSVVVNENGVFVWPHKSSDASPITFEFPLEKPTSILPLAILTQPASGASKDPGIVIIDAGSGLLKFYESVQHSSALGLIADKNLEITIPIESAKGEFVTFAQNVEPAGIVVVTSWKRVVLVNLRDYKSKPLLALVSLIKPHKPGFLSGILGATSEYINSDVVSIKLGSGTATSQEIIVQESTNTVHIFNVQLSSVEGYPYLDSKSSFKQNLTSYIHDSIEGITSFSSNSITGLDIWKLDHPNSADVYLYLCLIGDNHSSNESNLFLITVKIKDTGVLVYGYHRLNRYDGQSESAASKPALFVPKPLKTAFIVLNNSVIVTDIDYSYIENQSTVQLYHPRWEDAVTIGTDIEVIGYGYEDGGNDSNAALVLLTNTSGVLRIERFNSDVAVQEQYTSESVGSKSMIKSHIEQGIFYSSRSINFNITERFSDDAVIQAVSEIIEEIVFSTSQYVPPVATSIQIFLEQKSQHFHNLISYIKKNFSYVFEKCLPSILDALEQIEASLNLWKAIENNQNGAVEILSSVIQSNNILDSFEQNDTIRSFFSKHIDAINTVLYKFIEKVVDSHVPKDFVLTLITSVLYDGVLVHELNYYRQFDYPTRKSWIFDTHILFLINDVFIKGLQEHNSSFEYRKILPKITRILYYFITEAIKFMEINGTDDESLVDYIKWYRSNKRKWVEALVHHGLANDAVFLAEEFEDFISLGYILDEERVKVVERFGIDSDRYTDVIDRFNSYFDKYQYPFAKGVFDFYFKTGNLQMMLNGFPNHDSLLKEYCERNSQKVASVAWIKEILDERFSDAAHTLLAAADTPNDSQSSQELKYSLAKLTAIASQQQSPAFAERKLFDIESKLIYIRIQNNLFEQTRGDVPEQAISLDAFARLFVNDAIEQATAVEIFGPTFETFIKNRPLSATQLITYLTLVKPQRVANSFANAFRIASLLQDEAAHVQQLQQVWVRLLAITDDWQTITQTRDLSDAAVVGKLQGTVLYQTLAQLNGRELEVLYAMLEQRPQLTGETEALTALNEQLHARMAHAVAAHRLVDWIKAIAVDISTSAR